ncbi:MAG: OmpH family outer membrane protein [Phycisphaerae bacterium]|nr:OmpH family outer membrane protein [Phycisphaerae bacterium]
MRNADRILVVAALVVACSSLLLHAGRGATAIASPDASVANDLGPTDGVVFNEQKLDVQGEATAPSTTRLRVEGSHLRWSDRATGTVWSIGSVHVDKLMKKLLARPSHADKRKELNDEALKQDADFEKRAAELQTKYGMLSPQTPEGAAAQQEVQALVAEYNRWREGSARIREKLFAEQVEEAYRELVAAVDTVAEKEAIDVVISFMPPSEPFLTDTLAGAREQVFARTLLRYPEAIDITEEVMKSLGITE